MPRCECVKPANILGLLRLETFLCSVLTFCLQHRAAVDIRFHTESCHFTFNTSFARHDFEQGPALWHYLPSLLKAFWHSRESLCMKRPHQTVNGVSPITQGLQVYDLQDFRPKAVLEKIWANFTTREAAGDNVAAIMRE